MSVEHEAGKKGGKEGGSGKEPGKERIGEESRNLGWYRRRGYEEFRVSTIRGFVFVFFVEMVMVDGGWWMVMVIVMADGGVEWRRWWFSRMMVWCGVVLRYPSGWEI